MPISRVTVSFTLLFLSVILLLQSIYVPGIEAEDKLFVGKIDPESIISSIDMARIEDHIKFFSGLGSRFSGYPGCERAADYIRKFFREKVSEVHEHRFQMVVPVDHGANVTILPEGFTLKVYPMWPNMVALPIAERPIRGRLLYVGMGSLEEMEEASRRLKVPVNGSILVMSIHARRSSWLNAVKLGAKAIIFYGERDAERPEFRNKFLNEIPLRFPRFYVPAEKANKIISLASRGVMAEVRSSMKWEEREAVNIIGVVKGKVQPSKYVIFTAYYDSFSYVPSLAPGAQEACGISVLLELARYFSANPAYYTIVFIAFSGHNLGLIGSRHFVQDYILNRWREFGRNVLVVINLDLHTDTNIIAPIIPGGFYGGRKTHMMLPLANYITKVIIPEVERRIGKAIRISGEDGLGDFSYLNLFMDPFPYDHEPFFTANVPAMSLITAYVARQRWGTPLDLSSNINLENLKPQVEVIFLVANAIANTRNLSPKYVPPSESWKIEDSYWASISGIIAEYNSTRGWYDPVPNALFLIRVARGGGYAPVSYQVSAGIWEMIFADEKGEVSVTGLGTAASQNLGWEIQAFKVDTETGGILCAPDLGLHKYSPSKIWIKPRPGSIPKINHHDFGYFVIFRCGSIIFFDPDDPSYMNFPAGGLKVYVNKFEAHSSPESYGLRISYPIVAFFVKPNTSMEFFIVSTHAAKYPLGLLINASEESPCGSGYKVGDGQQLILTNTPLKYAESFYWINERRIFRTVLDVKELIERQREAWSLIEYARNALQECHYVNAYVSSYRAWRLARSTYVDVRVSNEDSVHSILFFAIIIIPFSFLVERLLLAAEGPKRMLALLITYIFASIVMLILHPGFITADNPPAVLFGCASLILSIPALAMILSNFLDFIRTQRLRALAPRFARTGMTARALLAFSLGVGNMKRRRFRTALTLLSVTLIMISIVEFTSVSALTLIRENTIEGAKPRYNGILLRHEFVKGALSGVGEKILNALKIDYGRVATIVPRSWLYPKHWPFKVEANGRLSYAPAISGVTPMESEVTGVNSAIISGRWFMPGDRWACIIGKMMADSLDIKSLPATLSLMGYKFKVIGILDDEKFESIRDLDGENQILPVDLSSPGMPHYTLWGLRGGIILIPYETVWLLGGGSISNVAIKIENQSAIRRIAREIFLNYGLERYGLVAYVGVGNETLVYSKATSYHVIGWQYQVVPLMLITLGLLNLLLASVYERKGEIGILSSVGLTPLDISMIFLAEAIVYAVLGGTIGYISGIAIARIANEIFSLPISINPSSSSVVTPIIAAMLATVGSALYPMFKASRIVVPSLERKWKIPTKPKGDEWSIPLPFQIERDEEAYGILSFIKRFIEEHSGEDSPIFITEDVRLESRENMKILNMKLKLQPLEAHIRQEVKLIDMRDPKIGKHVLRVNIRRMSGAYGVWTRLNHQFIDAIRKQMLLWRSLPSEERNKYTLEKD